MRPLLFAALGALLLALPAAADGGSSSSVRLRGTVTARDPAQSRLTVASATLEHVLHVGSRLRPIRVGMRVALRGTALRRHGNGTRVLARDVTVVSSTTRGRPPVDEDDDEPADDELEVRGGIASLSPLTVGSASCVVPAGFSLAGFAVGELVEMTCDRIGGQWVLRKLESEDEDDNEHLNDDGNHSRPGGGDRGGDRGGHGD
jgi:hypothetical protein